MTFLVVALILAAGIAAYYAATAPRRTLKLLEESAGRKARVERLTQLFEDLGRFTEHSRVLIEQASRREGQVFADEEIDLLLKIRSLCESMLPGLDKESPILDRYYRNHIAVLTYVLGESDVSASAEDRFRNSIEEIYRFQAVESSNDPLALLEKRLATGRGISSDT